MSATTPRQGKESERPKVLKSTTTRILEPKKRVARSNIKQCLRKLIVEEIKSPFVGTKIIKVGKLCVTSFVAGRDGVFEIELGSETLLAGSFRLPRRSKTGCLITIAQWKRGAWEEDLGVEVRTIDPWMDDILPDTLRTKLRTAARDGSDPAAKAALTEFNGYLGDEVDHMLDAIVGGDELSETFIWTLWHMVRGPRFAMAMTVLLWVNGVRKDHVRQAYEMTSDVLSRFEPTREMGFLFQNVMGKYVSVKSLRAYIGAG